MNEDKTTLMITITCSNWTAPLTVHYNPIGGGHNAAAHLPGGGSVSFAAKSLSEAIDYALLRMIGH